MIKCPNCGAEYDAHEAKCPYCDTMYFPNAEKEYMEDLDDLKEDVEDLKDYTREEYKSAVKKEGKSAAKIVACVAGVLLVVAVGLGGLFYYTDHKYESDAKNAIAWVREAGPELNAMYAEKDYDGILDYWSDLDDTDSGYFWTWSHAEYMWAYLNYRYVKEGDGEEKQKEAAFDLIYYVHTDRMTTGEKSDYEQYKKTAMEYLTKELGMTEEEIQTYYEEEMK